MKKLLGIFLMFAILFIGCNKEELADPLNDLEKQQLESQISGVNKTNIVAEFYADLLELSKQTINISNGELIKVLPLYQKVYNTFDMSEVNFAILFDFILYDKKCEGEVATLSSLLLWDIADKNFSSVTETLREQNKLNNIDLIKLLLQS